MPEGQKGEREGFSRAKQRDHGALPMHNWVSKTPAAPSVHKPGIDPLIRGTHPALACLRAGLMQALHPSSSQAAHRRQHGAHRQQRPSLAHRSNPGQPEEELPHFPPWDWGHNCLLLPQGWGDPGAAAATRVGGNLWCHGEEPDSPANSLKWFPMSKAW